MASTTRADLNGTPSAPSSSMSAVADTGGSSMSAIPSTSQPAAASATPATTTSAEASSKVGNNLSSVPNPFAAAPTSETHQPNLAAEWEAPTPAGSSGAPQSPASEPPMRNHQEYSHSVPHYSHPHHYAAAAAPPVTSTQPHHHQGPIPRVVSALATSSPHLSSSSSPESAPPSTYFMHHHHQPAQFHPSHQQHPAVPASAVPSAKWTRENSCPNFSVGSHTESSSQSEAVAPRKGATNKGAGNTRRKNAPNDYRSKTSTPSLSSRHSTSSLSLSVDEDEMDQKALGVDAVAGVGVGDSVNSRRQKRLERNRESARLSRRRRKQYLEILEERVTQLSTEVDQGRRAHAAQAISVTMNKRREILEASRFNNADKSHEESVRLLDYGLGRTSAEMMLVATFKVQQLKSFSLPPQSKFILWLTLQNDQFFRGGRAASERLSAARIGERMLNSGNDRVPPAQSMWPLFCNEVGLSYDQEERVRGFQRSLLQSQDSWLQRHAARSANLAMASVHDTTQALSLRLGQKERSMLNALSPIQKIKFLSWTERKREKLNHVLNKKMKMHTEANKSSSVVDNRFKIDKRQHVAANLYILNHRLLKIMQVIPRAAPLVTGSLLMKLSRRPSFESLGRSPMDKTCQEGEQELAREQSFASSGSLKRSASAISMDGDRPQLLQISPDDAEETSKATIERVLGNVQEIIPPTPKPQYAAHHFSQGLELRIPSPARVTSNLYHHEGMAQPQTQQMDCNIHQQPDAQGAAQVSAVATSQALAPGHRKQSSFIPPHLNVVPEEMFPNDGTADDFFMSLVDEDWAIGEGIDMDTTTGH